MKKMLTLAILCLFLCAVVAFAAEKVEPPGSCTYCGMDRTKFAHSRMLVEYEDKSSSGTCSIRCMAVELANTIDKTPLSIKASDFTTKKLINAEKAFWVIGGEKPGVMSGRAKWAFASKDDAEAFIKANKGILAMFEDAIKAAYEDLYRDSKMIRDKRKVKLKTN